MAGRARVAPLLFLALAGCPQFQNNDWSVGGDASPSTEAGDDASTPDSPSGGGQDGPGGDVAVPDATAGDAPSSGDAAQDGMPSTGDTGAPEAGGEDSNAPDGSATVQKLYCGLTDPRGIALDAKGNVCWVGGLSPRGLLCAAADGSGTPTHIDTQSDASLLLDAFDLLFDATNVYWSNGGNNQVVVRPQTGGQPQEYFSGGGRVSFLAPGANATIWATDFPDPADSNPASSGEVIVGPSPGGTSSNAIYTGEPMAAGVGMYNGNVYWGTPNGLAFGSVVGNGMIYRIPSPAVAGLAVDSTGKVYFLAGGQSLYRFATGDTTATLVYTEPQGTFGAGDVALDATHVYFSEPDLGCIVRIAR
jgi:hypothetical protein